jgi:hypothetical protein
MEFNWVLLYPLMQTDSRYADAFAEKLQHIQGADYDERLEVLYDHRFDDDPKEWGSNLSELFMTWRKDPYAPTVAHTMEWACQLFKIDPEDYPWISVPMAASVLADLDHDNAYHNSHHFREVVILLSLMIDAFMKLHEMKVALTKNDIMMMLTAAAMHDFAHDGRGNFIDGMHSPSRMEKKSFNQAKDFLAIAGASRDQRDILELMLICTDVSRVEAGRSPSGFCRDAFHAHENNATDMIAVPEMLKPLLKDRKLSLMAMMLCEADMGLSAGLSYDFAKEMTRLVASESTVLSPSPTTLHGFMDAICHGGFSSPAAKVMMGDNFDKIYQSADQDIEDNVLYTQP